MIKTFAPCALALTGIFAAAPLRADPYICVGAMSDVEVLFHVRRDSYFTRNPLDGKALRLEYDGCGYRIQVSDRSSNPRGGDVLLVDRFGHVSQVVHRR